MALCYTSLILITKQNLTHWNSSVSTLLYQHTVLHLDFKLLNADVMCQRDLKRVKKILSVTKISSISSVPWQNILSERPNVLTDSY